MHESVTPDEAEGLGLPVSGEGQRVLSGTWVSFAEVVVCEVGEPLPKPRVQHCRALGC